MGFTTLLIVVAVACSSPQPVQSVPIAKPRLVAHRGASHAYPENTMPAFRRAWELGCEAIELDVHVTKDGVPIVIHDTSTRRVAGVDRAIADTTLAELRTLDVGAWKGHPGVAIPTLAEVVASAPEGRTVFVELKSGPETAPPVAAAARGTRARLALQSYHADTLAALARALPDAPAFWTVDPPREDDRPLPYPRDLIDAAKARGFHGLALFHGSVDDAFVAAVKDAGLVLDVWTINDAPRLEAWLAKPDVRWVETDRPELVHRM